MGPPPAPRPADDGSGGPVSTPWDATIGASRTRSLYHVDGAGLTAAVIDTGVNYRHEALGGGLGPGFKVVAGSDFYDHTDDPSASSQHGTAVAGLIASDDPAHPGVAPGAGIAALKVFADESHGSFDAIAAALQWVIDNHDRYHITVVNISTTDNGDYTFNWFAHDGQVGQTITSEIARLDTLRIPVVAATGNHGRGQPGIGFPAIVGDSLRVTATDGSGHVAADAQRLGALAGSGLATDLAAPGVGLTVPADGNTFTTATGTSFAAPLVTGGILLLQQIYESRFSQLPTVSDLEHWLQAGSDPVFDPTTGQTLDRLDLPKAASQIPGAPGPPVLSTTAPTPGPKADSPAPLPPGPRPALAPAPPPSSPQAPPPTLSSPGSPSNLTPDLLAPEPIPVPSRQAMIPALALTPPTSHSRVYGTNAGVHPRGAAAVGSAWVRPGGRLIPATRQPDGSGRARDATAAGWPGPGRRAPANGPPRAPGYEDLAPATRHSGSIQATRQIGLAIAGGQKPTASGDHQFRILPRILRLLKNVGSARPTASAASAQAPPALRIQSRRTKPRPARHLL